MNRKLVVMAFLVLAHNACSRGQTAPSHQSNVLQPQLERTMDTDRTQAVEIAKADALKKLKSLESYNVAECEDYNFWRVFFEPKDPQVDQKLLEYVIRKRGGLILRHDEIPLNTAIDIGPGAKFSPRAQQIGRDDAIRIAEADSAGRHESLKDLRRTVCELNFVWRIVYHPPEGWTGGGPHYLIDKRTGQILNRKSYQ